MSGDAMRATLQAQPTSEGDEKSTPASANSPEPQKKQFEREVWTSFPTAERLQPPGGRDEELQAGLLSGAAGGGDAECGRRAMSADGPPPKRFSRLKRHPGTKIFTKFADVKSRTSWTAERRKLLADMWDRGESASAIAAALGCKVGAVNVARARFGLKPRRTVSGRPPSEPDEPAHKIDRVAFFTSRLMEFCTEKELVAQTGHESYEWPLVVAKELVDNSIDACEEAGVARHYGRHLDRPGQKADRHRGQRSGHSTCHCHRHHRLQRPGVIKGGRYQSNPRAPRERAQDRFADGLCAGG
jgi:hypothetical protein